MLLLVHLPCTYSAPTTHASIRHIMVEKGYILVLKELQSIRGEQEITDSYLLRSARIPAESQLCSFPGSAPLPDLPHPSFLANRLLTVMIFPTGSPDTANTSGHATRPCTEWALERGASTLSLTLLCHLGEASSFCSQVPPLQNVDSHSISLIGLF